jgi:hypothetical protein
MRRFFARELTRLAPVTAACVFLGLLVFVGLRLLAPASWSTQAWELSCMIVLLGTPWLVASAAIAPDAESGGLGFMATLPISPAKQLLARLGAAAACVVLVCALALGLHAAARGGMGKFPIPDLALLGPFLFLGGALASATIRNTLAAFVVAPVFAGLPLALMAIVLETWRWPDLAALLLVVGALSLMAGVYVAFSRGGTGGRLWSPRALRLGVGTTAGVLVAVFGVSTALAAYDWQGYHYQALSLRSADASREIVTVEVRHRLRNRLAYERGATHFVRLTSGALVQIPKGQMPAALSPDGDRLLLLSLEGWIRSKETVLGRYVDLTQLDAQAGGATLRLEDWPQVNWPKRDTRTGISPGWSSQFPRAHISGLGYAHVCWRAQPSFVTPGGLQGFDGETTPWPVELGEPPRIVDVAGPVVLLATGSDRKSERHWIWTPQGLFRVPASPTGRPNGQDLSDRLYLSPGGRWVVSTWTNSNYTDDPPEIPAVGRVEVLETTSEASWISLEPIVAEGVWGNTGDVSFHFSPDESKVVTQFWPKLVVSDLAGGGRTLYATEDQLLEVPLWTPDGLVVVGDRWLEPDGSGTLRDHELSLPRNAQLVDLAAGPTLTYSERGGARWRVNARTKAREDLSPLTGH